MIGSDNGAHWNEDDVIHDGTCDGCPGCDSIGRGVPWYHSWTNSLLGCGALGCDSIGCGALGCDAIGCDSIGCDSISGGINIISELV